MFNDHCFPKSIIVQAVYYKLRLRLSGVVTFTRTENLRLFVTLNKYLRNIKKRYYSTELKEQLQFSKYLLEHTLYSLGVE